MLKEAAQEYEQTIRLVDLQSIGKAEADDLIEMYESAAQIYTQLNDIARAASLYSTLANFLNSKRWGKERADEFRQKAKERMYGMMNRASLIVMVAHDMGVLRDLATRIIWLDHGQVRRDGAPADVIREYTEYMTGHSTGVGGAIAKAA